MLVSVIGSGSGEDASIIFIWLVIQITLFFLKIGVFDLSGWKIVHKGHDQQVL